MSEKVIAAELGFGTQAASEAIALAKGAPNLEDRVKYLTVTVEILLGHLKHLESKRRIDEMNQAIGNI
jgi:hypothetical protein